LKHKTLPILGILSYKKNVEKNDFIEVSKNLARYDLDDGI